MPLKSVLALAVIALATSKPITVVHVVADDLGRQDLGYFNGGKTISPHINRRIKEGVFLAQYHTVSGIHLVI
jgi:arylsulfatase A-like enzyme